MSNKFPPTHMFRRGDPCGRPFLFQIAIYLLFIIYNFGFAPTAHASETATQSGQVTATIPTTPVSDTNIPPTSPILIRPINGSATANPHPEFVWTPSTDPDGNTIIYTLYLDEVATYLGISNTGNSAGVGYTTTIVDNEIRLIPTQALPDGEYDWYVRAHDPTNDHNNSTIWQLTIDTIPPEFTITNIDIHHDLFLDSRDPNTVPPGTSFEVAGPKDIYFTIQTKPNTTIQLSFYDLDNNFITQTSATTNHTNFTIYPYTHLKPGVYTVQIVAIDHVFLTSTIPNFQLIVTQPTLAISFPFSSPISILIPPALIDLPSTLAHLPATIAKISTREHIAVAIATMLAIAIYLLLLFLKRRRHHL